jgi:hypothetical protein
VKKKESKPEIKKLKSQRKIEKEILFGNSLFTPPMFLVLLTTVDCLDATWTRALLWRKTYTAHLGLFFGKTANSLTLHQPEF